MADKNTLDITLRTEFGKRANYKLRKAGKIPAVVYGGKEQRYVAIDDREFEKKYHRAPESLIISLMLNGEEQCEVLIKDYQDDILTGKYKVIDQQKADLDGYKAWKDSIKENKNKDRGNQMRIENFFQN